MKEDNEYYTVSNVLRSLTGTLQFLVGIVILNLILILTLVVLLGLR